MDQETAARGEIAPGIVRAGVPAWVDLAPYPMPPQANPNFIANGLCVLLDDSQIDLCGADRAWFYRRAEMVTAPVGAEQAAQFQVTFDPAFERIEVHAITVIRQGQRVEHVDTAVFDVLRREQALERLVFDGRVTVHVTIPDVRQGDIVETSHTRYGERRSLGGRHSAWLPFEWGVGIAETRSRRRGPKSRAIQERGYNNPPQATETVEGDIVDRRWRTFERPSFKYEGLTPPWTLQSASVQWSEWRDWAEVANAMTPLYEDAGALPAEIETEISRIEAAEKTPAGRATAVLRFAQSAFRYLAISMGEGGYTPRGLADICSTRYGDCKDKSKLFVAMARRLGIDACPALVNTVDGYALNELLPSGQLFNHCIVRLVIDKKTYWLDPTLQMQASPLATIAQCHYGWALPLTAGAKALERMPDPPVLHLTETREEITLGDRPDVAVRYQWEHKHRGVQAEMMRERFAREGAVGAFKAYADDIHRVWPKARVVSQDLVADDVAANTLTVREIYDIDDAWTLTDDNKYRFQTYDLTFRGCLAPLDPGDRRFQIYLGLPGRRSRHVDIKTAVRHGGGWSRRWGSGELSFNDELRSVSPKWLVLEQNLVINKMVLPPKDAETYRKVQHGMMQNELVIAETLKGKKFASQGGGGGGFGWWSALRWIWLVLVVGGVVARCATTGGS